MTLDLGPSFSNYFNEFIRAVAQWLGHKAGAEDFREQH
jgi:hypothetical protein